MNRTQHFSRGKYARIEPQMLLAAGLKAGDWLNVTTVDHHVVITKSPNGGGLKLRKVGQVRLNAIGGPTPFHVGDSLAFEVKGHSIIISVQTPKTKPVLKSSSRCLPDLPVPWA